MARAGLSFLYAARSMAAARKHRVARTSTRSDVRAPVQPVPATVKWTVCAAATAAAILERLWFPRAWGEAGSLTSAFYYGDAPRFVDYALAVIDRRTFDNGIPFHPPGWPLVLAAYLKLTGVHGGADPISVGAVKLFVACLSGATVGLGTIVAGELAGLGAMFAVAVMGPFHFGHVVEGSVANSEALYGLLLTAAMWTASRWIRQEAARPAVFAAATGVASGAASLVRPEFLAGAVILGAFVVKSRRAAAARQVAVFALAYCAVLLPTTVWHWRTISAFNAAHVGRVAGPLPRFAPVTSYGPFNFAMANHENADGGPNRDHPLLDRCNDETGARLTAGQLDLECAAVYELYVDGYRIGAAWLVAHPIAALNLLLHKLEFTAGFLAQGYFVDDLGAGVDGVRRRVDLVDPAHWSLLPVHLLLAIVGGVALRRRPVAVAVLTMALVPLLGSTLLFYGYVRLGIAYLPPVWILEGAGIAALAAWISKAHVANVRTAWSVLAAIAVLCVWQGIAVTDRRAVTLEGDRTPDGVLIQDETLDIIRRP
jgi:hypothetical protein